MKIIADTHTHTISSGHAYSTLTENTKAAGEKGLFFLANTDHTGRMPGTPVDDYFRCQHSCLPDAMFGVYILKGCEVNILDAGGNLDLPDEILKGLDWVIASFHIAVIPPMDTEAHTRAWINIAKNPLVDVIGHSGRPYFPFDHEAAVRAFAAYGKIVEINDHSFRSQAGSEENCREIALLCKKYGVSVVVSSDAHHWTRVGCFERAVAMLEAIDFPEELVLNADYERFAAFLTQKCGRSFPKIK